MWDKVRQLRPLSPDVPVEYRLAAGDAAAEVVCAAAAAASDLIVMGTHGRSGLKHLLMGSVAERVVRQATCPVLTVKAPAPAPATAAAAGAHGREGPPS